MAVGQRKNTAKAQAGCHTQKLRSVCTSRPQWSMPSKWKITPRRLSCFSSSGATSTRASCRSARHTSTACASASNPAKSGRLRLAYRDSERRAAILLAKPRLSFYHRASSISLGGLSMRFRTLALRCTLAALALSFAALLVQARYPQPAAEYQGRRAKLRSEIDGPVVLFGYTSRNDAGEVAVFVQDENFYYLTGYSEPDAALVLIPDAPAGKSSTGPTEILYLPPRDPRESIWGGAHLGPNDPGVAEKTGFQAVRPFAELRGD